MSEEPKNQIRQLSRVHRRVLGALMEKAFTTPEQYPLTLKAAVSACNQKSNRDPVVNYTESQVQDALDAMRQDLLVAEVFPDSGRTARYRHYMRHKFDFSEVQFAIIAELLLRGKQQPGELRTRASRMVRIDSQEQLREALADLQEKGFIQTSGPLERRGVEVDHTFYLPSEGMTLATSMASTDDDAPDGESESDIAPVAVGSHRAETSPPAVSEALLAALNSRLLEQADVIGRLESTISDLDDRLAKLEREFGL